MPVLNVEWLNENAGRAYPFREDSGLRPTVDGAVSGALRLPNCAVLDFAMETSSYGSPPDVFMSAFTLVGGIATAVFSDAASGEVLASASAVDAGSARVPVNFSGVGAHDDIRGTVVFGDLSRVSALLPDGVWRYGPSETLLEPRCVRPAAPCLSGLFITDVYGSYETRRLRGDVGLVAGNNVRLSFDEDRNAVVISADPNYSYVEPCECGDADTRNTVKTVNGISAGEVFIEGDGECVSVETDLAEGRIRISDKCSKPCCGCAELTFLNEKTNELTTAVGNLRSFSESLHSKLEDFVSNALLSQRSSIRYV